MIVLPVATLVIGDRSWFAPAVLTLIVATLLLVIAYAQTRAARRTRIWALLPKLLAFVLLSACLIDPLWTSTRAKPGENQFVILADNSASLTIQSGPESTRGQILSAVLTDSESAWQTRLSQDFDVRRYTFDTRLTNVPDFNDLNFTGTSSSIESALSTIADRYQGRPLAGVLLFTDGNSTDAIDQLQDVQTLPPVYPVLPPAGQTPPDLSVTQISVSETVFEDSPITVQAQLTAHGLDGQNVVVELLDETGTVVDESRLTLSGSEPVSVRFETRPSKPGLTFYSVQVTPAEDGVTTEATLENNSRTVAVNREGRPYRVLYVAGRPNWEYRYLHRALDADPQVELVSLIRIARKEAKFDFRGREDESSNPLFRGFVKEGDEETESYDEAVLIRLGTKDEAELRDGFPKEKAQLYQYDALLLDDVEAEFFTHDQLALMGQFVSERGGGLLMLGGVDTFQQGDYAHTPVADLLPVYLDRGDEMGPSVGYRLSLSRDGWLQPWMRLRRNETDEQKRLEDMPAFGTVNRIESVKPGARVMAVLEGPRGESYPAIVAQRYGAGRSLAVLVGDLWRWSLHRESGAEDDLGRTWRQSVRWLVSDVPQRLTAEVITPQQPHEVGVKLTMRVRDAKFQSQENAELRINVTQPDGSSIELESTPSLKEIGLFESTFVPQQPGSYRATVTLSDAEEETPLTTTIGWTSDPAADEFRQIDIDRERMEDLAKRTGGEVVAVEELDSFVNTLPTRHAIVTETLSSPLWHRSWMFGLVLLCLMGEWGIRRLRGLP
ncbi:MAG: glutamine amidotransferase [Planctomycetaceae bacterium]